MTAAKAAGTSATHLGLQPPALTWDLILIRVLHPGLLAQDRPCDLHERRTVGDRWKPLDSDAVWAKRGPSSEQRFSVPSGRGRLRRSGPPRPGTDRPAGHGKTDESVVRNSRLLVGRVVDLGGRALRLTDSMPLMALAVLS